MSNEELLKKLAELEFANDQLVSEIGYLDSLMRSIGFSEGLATVKATARELLERDEFDSDEPEAA
ncbi:MAG: hypothetical protein Q8K75_01030 [Chlamydiales bacterium]|nr:hypothetical protein [Chlamydiales bacterium]